MAIPAPALDALRDAFGDALLLDEPLGKYASARIGGPADALLIARTTDDLEQAARLAWANGLPLFLLGGGANILIADDGVRGLTVINRADAVAFTGSTVTVDSGMGLIKLARACAARGLAGMEWAVGVPGTVGGAVYGNAGAHGGDMNAAVQFVDVVTPEGVRTLSNTSMGFEYRASILKHQQRPAVILGAVLGLTPGDPAAIQQRMTEYNDYRKRTQPPGATIGSMFKNPEGDYAGRLIEAAGLKGTRIGGAEISTKHANFFLNVGEATGADLLALIKTAQEAVQTQFGVMLELEVELIGVWPGR